MATTELKEWLAEWPTVRESVEDLVLSLKRRCVALYPRVCVLVFPRAGGMREKGWVDGR